VSDGSLSDSEVVTITVGNGGTVNNAPVLAPIGNKTVNEGATLAFTVSASDPDGDSLSYSASGLPSGASFNTSSRVFYWVPGAGQAGSYPVTFTVSDGSLSDSEVVTITVGNGGTVNNAPVLAPIGNKTVNEGATLAFTVSASDPDGDSLSYSSTGLPSGASFNTSSRVFSWTPGYTQAGVYQATFTASDGSLADSETVTLMVNNVNRAPVLASIGNKTVNEGATLAFTVTASDADGDGLSYSASGLPSGASFNASTRVFYWTLAAGQAGSHPVTFVVTDGTLSDSETVTITVIGGNRPPQMAALSSQTVDTDSTLSFTVSATDPDGDSLSYSATGLPSGASFNTSTRVFYWTPGDDQVGTYAVTFTVSDGSLSDAQTVRLTVVEPVTGLLAEWPLDEGSGNTVTNVVNGDLGNLVNFNFDSSSGWVSWGSGGSGSALAFDGFDDRVTLDSTRLGPANNFTVLVWIDPADVTAKQTVIALRTRLAASGLRVLIEDGYLKAEGQTAAGLRTTSFTGTALIPGEWNLVAVVYDQSTMRGYVNGLAAGSAAWGADLVMDPAGACQLGEAYGDYYQGMIDDVQIFGEVLTAADIAAVYDAAINHAPVLAPIGNRTVRVKNTLTFTISATDQDGDALTYSAGGVPSGASFNPSSRVFSWSTKQPDAGSYTVTFTVADGELTDSETITISVVR
ncbi:putative Ig domain-containing protein, partial [bacterium]|nr:putative Ig domain-containing protein [bacterium]